MMKKTSKRLQLETQTIRDLSAMQLGGARGGDLQTPCGPDSPTSPCTAWECTTLISCQNTCAWTHP